MGEMDSQYPLFVIRNPDYDPGARQPMMLPGEKMANTDAITGPNCWAIAQ